MVGVALAAINVAKVTPTIRMRHKAAYLIKVLIVFKYV